MPSPPDNPNASLAQALHDLRTPLTVMRGRIYLMRRRLRATPASNQAELLRLMDDVDDQITALCQDLDALERLADKDRH